MVKNSSNKRTSINDVHSQKLRLHYGTLNLQIVKHINNTRIALLKDGKNVVCTLAITVFSTETYSENLQKIDKLVKNGGFIGESIMQSSFDMVKTALITFKLFSSEFPFFPDANMLQGQVYELFVRSESLKD